MWAEEQTQPARLISMSSRRIGVVAALLWVGAMWFWLVTLAFVNDHFGRISPARQIVVYGELPFRDYFDPGYFLTELASAALMRVLGDNLLGEALLTTICIATGTVLVFLLAIRLTSSISISLAASMMALLLLPRAYDYDKVLFYPLGLWLCWRYVERPGSSRLWLFAAALVAAALFRYDTGVYLGAAMLVALAVVHARNRKVLIQRIALVIVASVCLAFPFLAFIEFEGGIADAIDQVVTYGRRETERTRLPSMRMTFAEGVDANSAENANVFLTYFLRLTPLAGIMLILHAARSGRASAEQTARLASLIAACVCLNIFILREPVAARIGGMAGPAAVLVAWIAMYAWTIRAETLRAPARLTVAAVLGLTCFSAGLSADWGHRFRPDMVRPAYLGDLFTTLSESPQRLDRIPNRSIAGLVRYLRECTAPTDRVLVTWFAPDVYFYAQRGFASGVVAHFGGHWSEDRFAERSVDTLARQSAPVIITRTGDDRFKADYPLLARFLDEKYTLAGTTDFDDAEIGPGGYSVWTRRDRPASRTYADTSIPCFW
jgi:hypothetical protein